MGEALIAMNANTGNNFYLVIVGRGAAAFAAATKPNDLGQTVLMINDGPPNQP